MSTSGAEASSSFSWQNQIDDRRRADAKAVRAQTQSPADADTRDNTLLNEVSTTGHAPRGRGIVPTERRRQILVELRQHGSVTVGTLEDRFKVSAMTARRDLALLAEAGHARRTHGGALLPCVSDHEDSFERRLRRGVDQKMRIAAAIVETLDRRETMFIDSSSSGYYIVRQMIETGLEATILTNSVPVMNIVGDSGKSSLELIGLGGHLRELTRSLVGADTLRAIQGFYVDRVVFSVKGIERGGSLTDPDSLESEVKRAMIRRARAVVLIADAQKFDEHGLNVVAHASMIDSAWLADPPSGGVAILEAAGVAVHRV
jgi:DeoR/GlpR family transcriptional regulator of sugar metabolism